MIVEHRNSLYSLPPENYDAMMSTDLEKKIFGVVVREVKTRLKPGKTRVSKILDFCCGTGIVAEMLLAESRIEFVGVDKNKVFLDCARKKTSGYENFKFVLCDVLDYESSEKFDVALLTSAYHHVKNEFKAKLLRKVFGLLKREGVLVVYEKAIKPYSNEREFEESNEEFYAKRIAFLKKTERRGLSKKQLAALLNVCALSAAAEEEYKLDYARLIRDLNAAGFKIIKETKVWPSGEEGVFGNEKVGDFVLVAIKRWS